LRIFAYFGIMLVKIIAGRIRSHHLITFWGIEK